MIPAGEDRAPELPPATESDVSAGSEPAPARHGIYSSLVVEDSDMIGHVAYALYKRDKLNFCDSLQSTLHRDPTRMELETFIRAAGLPGRIASYRAEAERLLERFSEEVLDVAIRQVEDESQKELVRRLSEAKSWPRAIVENLVANVLAIAVVALLALIVYGTRVGFIPLLADALGYSIQTKTSNPLPSGPAALKHSNQP